MSQSPAQQTGQWHHKKLKQGHRTVKQDGGTVLDEFDQKSEQSECNRQSRKRHQKYCDDHHSHRTRGCLCRAHGCEAYHPRSRLSLANTPREWDHITHTTSPACPLSFFSKSAQSVKSAVSFCFNSQVVSLGPGASDSLPFLFCVPSYQLIHVEISRYTHLGCFPVQKFMVSRCHSNRDSRVLHTGFVCC